MGHRSLPVAIILLFVFLLSSQAQQQSIPVPRLGITGTTEHLSVFFVARKSAGEKAGIREKDQLLTFDDQQLATIDDLQRAVMSASPGRHVILLHRGGGEQAVDVKLGPVAPGRLGVWVASGMRIDSMERDAPALEFGLREGDVITSVRIDDSIRVTPSAEDLVRIIAAIPVAKSFYLTYMHGATTTMRMAQLSSQPGADASILAQIPSRPVQQAQARDASPVVNANSNQLQRGVESQPQTAPASRGRGTPQVAQGTTQAQPQSGQGGRRPGVDPNVLATLRDRRRMVAGRSGDGARVQSNTTLEQLLKKANYTRATAPAKRMAEINVLKYAYLDRNSGEVIFVGTYDPKYATGPIAYNALLKDALQNPYPRFTLEYPHNSSPLAQVRATLDQEFAHVARDPSYGVQWLQGIILPVLNGTGQDPDQQAALNSRLQASGIVPAHYRAFLRWQDSHFKDMQAYVDGAGLFLPELMQAAGLGRKVGQELTAYRMFASQATREYVEDWCAVAGYTDLLHRIDQQVKEGGSRDSGTTELLSALYGSILRELGIPEGQVSQILSAFRRTGNEALLVNPLNQKYQEVFQQALISKVVNGMVFTGATLSAKYNFPPILSPLNTYGAPKDSPIMDVFFQSDYILKFMTSSPRPSESIPQHQTSQEFLAAAEAHAGSMAGHTPTMGVNRFWLYPQEVEMDVLQGNSGVHFRNASMRIGVEMLQSEGADARGEQFEKEALQQYSTHLASLYEQYAQIYPALHALRETEKVIALARWAQKNGLQIRTVDDGTQSTPLPDSAIGFWGMTYIVRPTGGTDTMVAWAEGGVDFGQNSGDTWVQTTPAGTEETNDALRSLAASTALSEKAAAAAVGGDLEAARDLAQRGADAMSGSIDMHGLPEAIPVPQGIDPATAASVAQASVAAADMNLQGIQQANQQMAQAASLQATDPAQAGTLRQQAQQLKTRSEDDLQRLQIMLDQYRNTPSSGSQLVVDLRGLDPNKPPTVATLRPSSPPTAPATKTESMDCPKVAIPTRQELLTELAVRQAQLESLKNTIARFNHTIQLDQQQYAVWQDEAQAAIDRIKKQMWGMGTTAAFDWFISFEKNYYSTVFTDFQQRDKNLQKLEMLKRLKDSYDWSKLVFDHKNDWEHFDEEYRELVETFLKEDYVPYFRYAQYLLDNAFDVTDYLNTFENVMRLNHNSDQYLQIVKQNGERMQKLITRIQEIQTQLKTAPELPPNTPPCREAKGGATAR